jgi:hypothetical protein
LACAADRAGPKQQELEARDGARFVRHSSWRRVGTAKSSFPDSAGVSIEIDAARELQAWARSALRGFRALAACAAEADQFNGFWDWCERSGSGLWPANMTGSLR